jgi:adenine-specific DNA-methyltransferase
MPTLNFKGKTFVQNHHLAVKFQQLKANEALSLTERHSLHDNLIIQGDNLAALKALMPSYAGRVKCVYIDPPYNTGNEGWVYNDNVNSPMIQHWLGKIVDKEDLTRHDKWLCMMMPRLKLLRELMREDGAIFISIDDNEQHRLRMLMDEVFGEDNFITNIIWQKKYTQSNDAKYFSDTHDFIVAFAKDISKFELNLLERTEEQNDRYANPDNDSRGEWMSQPLHAKSGRDTSYTFTFKNGVTWQPPIGTYPRYSMDSLTKADEDNKIWFGTKGDAVPRMKKFLLDMKEGVTPKTIWLYSEVGSNDDAKKSIKDVFDDNLFETPKPVSLLKKILHLSTKNNDIILDSYAGSATTAQAVLELNKEDSGNRKFILVEMEDYANTITAERVRRVIKGVPTAKNAAIRAGLGGSFSYFELGDEIQMEWMLKKESSLPTYEEFARYLFFTATGEQLDASQTNPETMYVGESRNYHVFMKYQPDIEWLKRNGLTLDDASLLNNRKDLKKRLIFAPMKFVDDETLREWGIEFQQLPYDVYRMVTK